MLRANHALPVTIVCCVLTSMLCARAVSAGTIFFDDFNDGNAGDGTPVTWVPGSGNLGCLQRRLRRYRLAP